MVVRVGKMLRSPLALSVAAVLVGVAIVWDGSGARVLNGAGGITWVGSFVAMARSRLATTDPLRNVLAGAVLAVTVVLAVLVRPSDGLIALAGFGIAGAVVALLARREQVAWSVLVPAAWLPLHLIIAIGTSLFRAATGGESTVRTDPPPTTALVPLLMVVSAWGAGFLVLRWRGRPGGARTLVRDPA